MAGKYAIAGRVVLLALTLAGSSAATYLVYLHRTLSQSVKHTGGTGLVKLEDDEGEIIQSLPPDLGNPSVFFILNDVASKSVSSAILPKFDDSSILLTTYLRCTMSSFSKFPQAHLLRLLCKIPEAKKSFDPAFIQSLDFVAGEVVCGVYRVEVRTKNQVEFGMLALEGMPPVDGRLVINIREKGAQTVFRSETLQWRRLEDDMVLPLERRSMKWLHELASWYLLESGTKWLSQTALRASTEAF